MNNNVRDFYQMEEQYEQNNVLVRDLIKKIMNIDINLFKQKLDYLDKELKYTEFLDLYNAVIGKKTKKYYFCENLDDVKYYDLKFGEVYKMSELNPDIQTRNNEEKVLKLKARVILSNQLINLTNSLIEDFKQNLGKSDGSISTFDSVIIKEQDIKYLETLLEYLKTMQDETGRLKILVIEKEEYALQEAKESYNKKSSVEKWFYKTFKQENAVINNMAKKNRERK